MRPALGGQIRRVWPKSVGASRRGSHARLSGGVGALVLLPCTCRSKTGAAKYRAASATFSDVLATSSTNLGQAQIRGSLGFRRVTVLESPTCWGLPRHTPNKLGTPARYPRQLPKTQIRKSTWRKAHYLALLQVSHIPVLDNVASTDQRLATSVSTMLAFPLGGGS